MTILWRNAKLTTGIKMQFWNCSMPPIMETLCEDPFMAIRLKSWKGSVGKVRKKLPIGIDGFEKIRTNDFYYVDKTLFIKELLQNWGEVNLFTRPRRFGKSLNMSMLKIFLK